MSTIVQSPWILLVGTALAAGLVNFLFSRRPLMSLIPGAIILFAVICSAAKIPGWAWGLPTGIATSITARVLYNKTKDLFTAAICVLSVFAGLIFFAIATAK